LSRPVPPRCTKWSTASVYNFILFGVALSLHLHFKGLITGSEVSQRPGITWQWKPGAANCHCVLRSRLRERELHQLHRAKRRNRQRTLTAVTVLVHGGAIGEGARGPWTPIMWEKPQDPIGTRHSPKTTISPSGNIFFYGAPYVAVILILSGHIKPSTRMWS